MTQLRSVFAFHKSSRIFQFAFSAIVLTGAAALAHSQAITINTSGGNGPVMDRRYAQIEPTAVPLPTAPIDAHGHQDLLRALSAEQGFAMRPLPRGKKGLTLEANGKLKPSGEGYLNAITEQGLSVKPGDRVVLSNVRIEKERIVLDLNGGPERKHEFLRHVQIGLGGPNMNAPAGQDDSQEPSGSRVIVAFAKYVPDVTPAQFKALLAPLISFDIKTPVQAYTDTLPPKLKAAILDHHVLVGMNTDMVLFTLGQPESKSRELEGQMPFEEWIYGHPPQDVNFVRVNGNRVIRVEIAKLGQPLEIFTKDEVEGLMLTTGQPVLADASTGHGHRVQLGDVQRDPNTQSATAPPSLRAPGEKLPTDVTPQTDSRSSREGAMKPVIFPKDTTNEPARTVPAHSKPAAPTDEDEDDVATKTAGAKQGDSKEPSKPDAPARDQAKPATAPPATAPASASPLNLLPAS